MSPRQQIFKLNQSKHEAQKTSYPNLVKKEKNVKKFYEFSSILTNKGKCLSLFFHILQGIKIHLIRCVHIDYT